MKFSRGQKVITRDGANGVIQKEYCEGMYEVRLFDDFRTIGEICIDCSELKLV